MSLYFVQKLLYQINRDPHTRERYDHDFVGLLGEYQAVDGIDKLGLGALGATGDAGRVAACSGEDQCHCSVSVVIA